MAQRPKEEEVPKQPTPDTPRGEQPAPQPHSYPAYLQAALRTDSARALGARNFEEDIVGDENRIATVPGICVIDWVPTLGVSHDVNSALNRTTQRDFRATRSGISGSRKWEPVDQEIYRICAESLQDLYNYAKRIYRICNGYSALNYYRPAALLKAMGLNPTSWMNSASQLYQWMHTNSSSMESFPVVKYGSITDRHTAYNTTIYMDGDISRAQMYVLNQRGFWTYEKVDEVKGLTLRVLPENATYTDFLELWNAMYTAMQQSADVAQIVSDIERVYPQEKLIKKLTPPAEFEQVPIGKFDSALASIRNATIIPLALQDPNVIAALRIRDDNGVLKSLDSAINVGEPADLETLYWQGSAFLPHINIVEDVATENVVLDSVRLKPSFRITQAGAIGWQSIEFDACGTEIACGMRIVFDPDLAIEPLQLSTYIGFDPTAVTTASALVATLSAVSNFDWHPPIAVGMLSQTGTKGIYAVVEDIQNYVPIRRDQLKDIHENNLLYEFGIEA